MDFDMAEEGVCGNKTGSVLLFDSDSRFRRDERMKHDVGIEDGREREADDRPMCVLG